MRTTIFIFISVFCACFLQAQTVNIPDQQFYNALINDGAIDLDNDGLIQVSEAEAVDTLKVANSNISDLTGIAAFKNITYLDCSGNELSDFDLSANKSLTSLYCGFNQINNLDVSKNTKLKILDCGINPLGNLDVSKNTNLEELHCFYNELNTLNVSSNVSLKLLRCDNNNLKSLDLSKNVALTNLSCPYNQLLALNVSSNSKLEYLDCYDNKIIQLDLSENPLLTYLQCYSNLLQSLNVSENTSLQSLVCTSNPSLKIICVWDVAEVEQKTQFQKDPTAKWVDTCKNFTHVNDDYNTNSLYKLHPNPVEEVVYMSPQVAQATFYDAIGVMVLKSTPVHSNVDLSSLNTGVYTVKLVYSNGQTSFQKLFKK